MKRDIIGVIYIDGNFEEAKIEMTKAFYEYDGILRADFAQDILYDADKLYDWSAKRMFNKLRASTGATNGKVKPIKPQPRRSN